MNYTGLRQHNKNEQQKQTLENVKGKHLNSQGSSGSNISSVMTSQVFYATCLSKYALQYYILCYLQLSQNVKSMTTDGISP